MALLLACTFVEIALYLALIGATLHLGRAAAWALARGPARRHENEATDATSVPFVTVQLPLRNEPRVVEELLRCTAALDWPRDRFEIQVLDDSDDETVAIADRVAAELRATGLSIEVLRRPDRRGYKAGALALGLARARGELVLVLDADFRPARSLVRELASALSEDDELAFVQARWSYRNEAAGLLTRLQAAILDALFAVEQAQLSARNGPVQFNGTAGLWRRSAIERAGGWATDDDALTEDLDLSFRAHEVGLRGITLPELAVSTELPEDVGAFVAQQTRWVRGGGLGLRTLGRRLLSRGSSADARTMLAHLVRHARQPLFVAAMLRLSLVALAPVRSPVPSWVGPAVFAALLLALGAYLGAAARRLGKSFTSHAALAPALAALSIGLAPALSVAFLGGVFGRRGDGFVRTEKLGDGAPKVRRSPSKIGPARVGTILLAATSLAAAILFGQRGDWVGFSAAALCASGCGWMSR